MVTAPNTMSSSPDQPSAQPMSAAGQLPAINSRTAVATWVTGLLLTKACSQPGIVEGSTKTLLRTASGKITSMLTPITDFAVRSSRPNIVQIQENENAKIISSTTPARTPSAPPS